MQKILIIVGLATLIIGIAWPWLGALPFGRLPGDIIIDKGNFKFYFPLTTMVIISALITLIVWLFRH